MAALFNWARYFACAGVLTVHLSGWDEAVPTMSLGEKALLHITADYGYGAKGVSISAAAQ